MIYNYEKAASVILEAGRKLMELGLVARTWGNISARVSKDAFLITPSGRPYESLTAEDLVRVSVKDASWSGDVKPSSEKALHAGLYRLRPEVGAIVHTHQSNASAVSVLGEDFDLVAMTREHALRNYEKLVTHRDVLTLGTEIPCAPYAVSSTGRLARNVVKTAAQFPAARSILMRNHGAVCMGVGMNEAFDIAEKLEEVCGRIFERRCMQFLPAGEPLPPEVMETPDGVILRVRTPFIMEMSLRGRKVPAYLDDAAQIFGGAVSCMEEDREDAERALAKCPAVLVRGDGALCMGADLYEAQAAAMVLEKNCQAALLGLKKASPPVNPLAAALEHRFYVNKYSKRKDG